MTSYQKSIIYVFGTITIALLMMEFYDINGDYLSYIRYLAMFLLFLTAYAGKGKTREQKILFWAFPLMLIGDFFLVFSYVIEDFPQRLRYLGFLPFASAYMIMAKVYIKGFRWGKMQILLLIFYTVCIGLLTYLLMPYVDGVIILAGSIVIIVVTGMAWLASAAVWNGCYKKSTAMVMAFSGFLMLVCDYGVAFDLFHPSADILKDAMIVNLVWLSYLPGWVLLAYIVVGNPLGEMFTD